jgi:ketosteroid isomerase-like protein
MTEGAASIVKRVHDCYLAGDLDGVQACMAEDVVQHDHGTNARAGIYLGKNGISEFIALIYDLTDGTISTTVKEILGGIDYAAVIETATAERNGQALNLDVCTVWHLNEAGVVDEIHIMPLDQGPWDQFWA